MGGGASPRAAPLPPGSGKPPANAADAAKDSQRKTDEFAEAAAGDQRPGRQPGMRLARPPSGPPDVADDLDTAFRHLDLYDRFGCPAGHVQATFRCLTQFADQIDDKVQKSLDDRIHACWINPQAQPQTAAAATPAPSPSTAGAAPATQSPSPSPPAAQAARPAR